MPLTCAPLGMGVVNRMIGCREPALGGQATTAEESGGGRLAAEERRRPFSGRIRLTPDGLP
jgi:hypothetical protein